MKKEYDFSKMKSRENAYASKLTSPVTTRFNWTFLAPFYVLPRPHQ